MPPFQVLETASVTQRNATTFFGAADAQGREDLKRFGFPGRFRMACMPLGRRWGPSIFLLRLGFARIYGQPYQDLLG